MQYKAFTEVACQCNCFSVEGVFGVKLWLELLPWLTGGVGVQRQISSFEITRSGSYGTNPAAAKLFLIVLDL